MLWETECEVAKTQIENAPLKPHTNELSHHHSMDDCSYSRFARRIPRGNQPMEGVVELGFGGA